MGHDASLTFCFNKKNREALLTVYNVEFFLSKILRELHLYKKKKKREKKSILIEQMEKFAH